MFFVAATDMGMAHSSMRAGGPRSSDAKSTLRDIRECIEAGAQDVVVGRKIWQRPPQEAADMITEIAGFNRSAFKRRR
jgi:fructose-bisphosphate aldolase, class I